jgi:uncharacterized membrane protein HdeD (DUF308 family)
METVQNYWKFFLIEGIALFFLGLLAIGSPQMTTISLEYVIGILLFVGGIVQLYRAWNTRDGGKFFAYLSALVTVITGILVFTHPIIGTITLTLLIASYFLVEGLLYIFYAIKHWSLLKWKGLLLNGIVTLALGLLIMQGWPDNSLWVIGLYVGIYLVFLGLGLVVMAFQLRRLRGVAHR